MSHLHQAVKTGSMAMAVGIVLLVPAHGREVARHATCQSNLKQIGLGLLMYAQANDGLLPPVDRWQEAAAEYIKNHQVFVCPEAGSRSLPHYSMEQSLTGVRVGALSDPRNAVLVYDGVNGLAAAGPEGGVNVLFADGHVKRVMDVTPYGLTKEVA
ncbi:MAG: DUF1559 domain-containing protein, partial [Armatimonadetes bacterium]|nr:DUF1559 domain-containing protein [Armatimonadota bacterium]